MNRKNKMAALKEEIIFLQDQQTLELILLEEHFRQIAESLKPINLLKSTLKETITAPQLKENAVSTTIGLAAGYLSKLLFINVSRNPLIKILGTVLQFTFTKMVAKNPEGIKSVGKEILNGIKNKLSKNSNRTY